MPPAVSFNSILDCGPGLSPIPEPEPEPNGIGSKNHWISTRSLAGLTEQEKAAVAVPLTGRAVMFSGSYSKLGAGENNNY